MITIKLNREKNTKSYIKIMDDIRQLIIEGGLSPGDRLLSERDLATKLNVSRTVVREALKSLEMIGIIEVRAGGTYIKEPELKGVYHTLSYTMALDHVTVTDLLETRKIIEVQAIKLAAVRRTREDLKVLAEILNEMKESLLQNDLAKSVEADHKFHSHLVKASQNKVLSIMMSATSELFRESLSVIRENLGRYQGMDQVIYSQHYTIYKAIQEKNMELAESTMLEHLESVENEIQMILQGYDPVIPDIPDIDDDVGKQ